VNVIIIKCNYSSYDISQKHLLSVRNSVLNSNFKSKEKFSFEHFGRKKNGEFIFKYYSNIFTFFYYLSRGFNKLSPGSGCYFLLLKKYIATVVELNFTTKEMISIFPLRTFHLYVATLQQHLHMEYISLSSSDIPELLVPIIIFFYRGLLLTRKQLNQSFLVVKLKSSLRKFYSRLHDFGNRYGISASQMTTDMVRLS
jgi:hypothetical protein